MNCEISIPCLQGKLLIAPDTTTKHLCMDAGMLLTSARAIMEDTLQGMPGSEADVLYGALYMVVMAERMMERAESLSMVEPKKAGK